VNSYFYSKKFIHPEEIFTNISSHFSCHSVPGCPGLGAITNRLGAKLGGKADYREAFAGLANQD
jgi:hypothetical protein